MRMLFPHQMPGRFLDELASDMNALVGSLMGEESATSNFLPAMDVEETEKSYLLSLDLPGVKPDDISIEVEDGHVKIHGERAARTRSAEAKSDEVTSRRAERSFGEFDRQFRLPEIVDEDRIEASYEHGVLTICLPKQEKKARKIVVTEADASPVDDSEHSASS